MEWATLVFQIITVILVVGVSFVISRFTEVVKDTTKADEYREQIFGLEDKNRELRIHNAELFDRLSMSMDTSIRLKEELERKKKNEPSKS